MPASQYLPISGIGEVRGAVVAIDVLRAFSTAAYAFGAGAERIYLVGTVAEALRFKAEHPAALAMGEEHGLMPVGFDLPNSPVRAALADMHGRTVVQRTSNGTAGVVAAAAADGLWCSALVCASATAAAVTAAGLGDPTYIITGLREDRGPESGSDDLLTARYIEAVRRGEDPDPHEVARAVHDAPEASLTLLHGAEHADPRDIEFSVRVDRFDFAMEVVRDEIGLRLHRRDG